MTLGKPEVANNATIKSKRYRKDQLRSNIKGIVSGISIERIQEREAIMENLRRVSSLKIIDPDMTQYEREFEERKLKKRLKELTDEIEDECEKILATI